MPQHLEPITVGDSDDEVDADLATVKEWRIILDRDFLTYLSLVFSVTLGLFLFSSADRITAQSWFGRADDNNLGYINWTVFDGYQTAGLLGRALLWGNAVKLAGTLAMCLHVNPFLSYAIVGAGAAAYSPAKYGILAELVAPTLLVKANGLIESATIVSILLGAVAGGVLTDWSLAGALGIVAGCYAAAMLATLLIPTLRPARAHVSFAVGSSIRTFASQVGYFLKSADLRAALIGTGVFWGAGAALRFLLIAWVPATLKIEGTSVPGYLTGMVAAGIAVGAVLAGRFVKLEAAHRAIPAGILLGVGVSLLPLVHSLPTAFVLMAWVGVCSGFLVVPLDALLQQRGARRGGVGSAIAIQNLFENVCMLILMSAYVGVSYAKVAINTIAFGFGLLIAVAMALLVFARSRRGVS